jgi:phosphatidate cytidylyltransferase
VPKNDSDHPSPPPNEGVRILGAEEAQAMAEGGGDRPVPEEPRPPRVTPPDARPSARFPLPADGAGNIDMPTPRPVPAPPLPADSTGSLPLPHWTEPPTGEVPQFGGDVTDVSGEDDLWSGVSEPRFRSDVGDYAGSGFGDDPLHDDTTALGALVDMPEIDDEEEFAAEVAARRGPGRRGRSRGTHTAPPPREAAPPGPPPEAAQVGAIAGGGYDPDTASAPARSARRAAPAADDITTRIVTALILAAVALLAFTIGRAATAVLITVIVAAAAMELFDGLRRAGFQPATLIGLLGSLAMVGIAYNYGERAFPLVGVIVLAFTLFWYLAKVVHARPMVNAAVTLLGYTYIGVLGGFAGLLLAYPDGLGMIIGLVLCAVAYDIVGYIVGSRMGRHALAPEISPNKTVEGLVAGMAAAVFMGAVISQLFGLHPWNDFSNGLLLGLVVAIFAPLGDLCESMLKRDLGLKDFGTLLPGHGGVLDRFDAMLFCLPAVYYLVVARGII